MPIKFKKSKAKLQIPNFILKIKTFFRKHIN